MPPYARKASLPANLRIPLEGNLDLTYRCNNVCRHCWLWLAPNASQQAQEMSFAEICSIADQARSMGTRTWHISGGEPMLRPDFADIFDYLTRSAPNYSLNTNGTLITPSIAQLLKRKGTKMVALYGATAEVYDDVTRNPGGFEAAMRGFRYLQEAGAGFIVQMIPMRQNWHQWAEMQALAESLSAHQRVGAPWLYLSSSASTAKNREIAAQRLAPADVIMLDQPVPTDLTQLFEAAQGGCGQVAPGDDRLFASCISKRTSFHIDPYGQMSWCSYIKDPDLRYNLRTGTFRQAWDEFIPACADRVHGGEEWRQNCGSCENRKDCRWCAVYAHLETGSYSARVPYLCSVAEEAKSFKQAWRENHRRYFQIAGMTICLESDHDLTDIPFKPELTAFETTGPGDDNIVIKHHFALPDLSKQDTGSEVYRQAPWAISHLKNGAWLYRGISPDPANPELYRAAVFSGDYRRAEIYSQPGELETLRSDGWQSLALFPTDQIWLAPLLAERQALLIHSAAAVINGQGLVFIGHSSAGKSTTMELLKAANIGAEVLCDDRNVLRKWGGPAGEWRVHGTWSHGTTADVSPAAAPLRAVLFLHKDTQNCLEPLTARPEIWRRLLATLIRPLGTADWWQKELDILERLVQETAFYTMHFDQSGAIVPELERLCA